MTDIVERLRVKAKDYDRTAAPTALLMEDAAKVIEQLRAELITWIDHSARQADQLRGHEERPGLYEKLIGQLIDLVENVLRAGFSEADLERMGKRHQLEELRAFRKFLS